MRRLPVWRIRQRWLAAVKSGTDIGPSSLAWPTLAYATQLRARADHNAMPQGLAIPLAVLMVALAAGYAMTTQPMGRLTAAVLLFNAWTVATMPRRTRTQREHAWNAEWYARFWIDEPPII